MTTTDDLAQRAARHQAQDRVRLRSELEARHAEGKTTAVVWIADVLVLLLERDNLAAALAAEQAARARAEAGWYRAQVRLSSLDDAVRAFGEKPSMSHLDSLRSAMQRMRAALASEEG